MPSPGANSTGAPGPVPRRAAVTPRVRTAAGGAALPLEYHVRGLLRAGACGIVNLFGPAGSGKTAAAEHLAELFRDEPRLVLYDCNHVSGQGISRDVLVISTTRARRTSEHEIVAFQLAAWTDDDLIEYLANTHRGRVASVMKRVAASPDRDQLEGLPEVWRMVLDVLAADESVPDIWAALRWYVGLEIQDPELLLFARVHSLSNLAMPDNANLPVVYLDSFEPRVRRLVRHRCVQLPLAAECLGDFICTRQNQLELQRKLPYDLLRHIATLYRANALCIESLCDMVRIGPAQSNAASILHAMGIGWRPDPASVPRLEGAHLDGAQWPGVNLRGCVASGAHFVGANLSGAALSGANLDCADFSGACLRNATLLDVCAKETNFTAADLSSATAARANLRQSKLERADLSGANLSDSNLSSADLRGATLRGAHLTGAILEQTQIGDADFSTANLTDARLPRTDLGSANFTGAVFAHAQMEYCNLEYMELPGANFHETKLRHALLTGSTLPGANFRRADLRFTGLADVEWEGADLRKADLTGASFHAGSTRSGLVGSTVPGEGSRTGFYTDDFNDRDFKSPEEIRKANLCGADLRGAKTEQVDFYLVDLRGARYTRSQAKWFRKCGAIMR